MGHLEGTIKADLESRTGWVQPVGVASGRQAGGGRKGSQNVIKSAACEERKGTTGQEMSQVTVEY